MSSPTTTPPAPTAAKPAATEEKTKQVKYTGDAGTREITKAQWKQAGAEGQEATVWNAENGYALPITNFSEDALEILKRDRNIKVV